jgi:glycine C-acetyltransferase
MPITLERRKCLRTPLQGFKVFSRYTGRLVGESRNISPNGMFIETENPLKPNAKMLLEFKLPNETIPIKTYSEVKWNNKGLTSEAKSMGMGVQFVNIYKLDKKRLAEYSKSLNGENSPKEETINSNSLSLADFIEIPDKDLFTKTNSFWEAIQDMTKKGFNTYARPLTSSCRNRVLVRDEKTGKMREMIMMGSNNYLGLTSHPKVIKAAKEVMERYGVGAGSVPLLAGTYDLHKELELRLAGLKGCEDAIVFSSGYVTNLGCIQALVKREDIVIIDRLAHASIIDGSMLSAGAHRTFKHSNVESLKQVLEETQNRYNGKLLVVDGVYSMDGDIAPLPQIIEVAHRYGAKVMVDEAHATGVIGERGRGTPSHFKVEGKVDIVMGTLSKALGGLGGFIASSKEVVNYLRYNTRSFFFSSNLPPSIASSVQAAIEVMENDPELHQNLWKNIKYMKENLGHLGLNIGNSESAIIPIIIGDELTLRKMGKRIHEERIYLNAIPYPAVPRGQERFRLSIMATHTREDLDKTLEVLEKVGREFGVLKRPFRIFEKEAA